MSEKQEDDWNEILILLEKPKQTGIHRVRVFSGRRLEFGLLSSERKY